MSIYSPCSIPLLRFVKILSAHWTYILWLFSLIHV
jgi:hypothetical protein